jgi:hypothetical protein
VSQAEMVGHANIESREMGENLYNTAMKKGEVLCIVMRINKR